MEEVGEVVMVIQELTEFQSGLPQLLGLAFLGAVAAWIGEGAPIQWSLEEFIEKDEAPLDAEEGET
jgi:hypothetical protein